MTSPGAALRRFATGDREGRVPELVLDHGHGDAFGDLGGVGVAQLVRHGVPLDPGLDGGLPGKRSEVFSCHSVTSTNSAGALPPYPLCMDK